MIAKLRFVLSITIFFVGFCGLAQQNYWTPIASKASSLKSADSKGITYYQLDAKLFSRVLNTKGSKGVSLIQFPDAEGTMHRFRIRERPIFHPELAKKYPNIKSFTGVSEDGKLKIRFSHSPSGLQTMMTSHEKGAAVFLEKEKGTDSVYRLYRKSERSDTSTFICGTKGVFPLKSFALAKNLVDDQILRTYRIAVSTTGEYTDYHGGTVAGALAAINATLTRVNAVFETDLGVTLQLVPNNDEIIFIDPSTDPYIGSFNAEVQNTLTSIIGEENYDVGHLFHLDNDNGNAGFIGSVCTDNRKGSAFASALIPEGDLFDLDYVAHELGHQFGANHTWSFESEGTGVQVEPASGTTIMGYAGIVGGNNVAPNGDDYFHHVSIAQIQNYLESTSCASTTSIGNNPPTITSHPDYIIPKGTPFVLTGNATDVDGDVLTYSWEQIDDGVVVTSTFGPENVSGANFRSLPPSTDSERYFPNLNQVLNGSLEQVNPPENGTWETVSNVQRELNFALTVRDNNPIGGQVSSDSLRVSVVNRAGPFQVTSQNTNETYVAGSVQEITWDVANTHQLPVNAQLVDILLSTDGGENFNEILIENAPNTGNALVQLPGVVTTNARVMIKASDNIFFAVNNTDFTIEETPALLNFEQPSFSTCQPSDITIPFVYETSNGFSESMSLSINATEPFTATFSQPLVSENATAVDLILSNLGSVPVGIHSVEVIATGSTFTTSTILEVRVFDGVFEEIILTLPMDASIGTDVNPELQWEENTNYSSYDVEIALDEDFNTIVETTSTFFASYQTFGLLPETTYYWRIRPRNSCGEGTFGSPFRFTTSLIDCKTFDASDVPIEISSAGTPTIVSKVFLSEDLKVSDVNVSLEIAHTFLEDLVINLTSPEGTKVTLLSKNCGNLNNITAVFDDDGNPLNCLGNPAISGIVQPLGALASFQGESTLGEWVLEIQDTLPSDGGFLNAFSLEICVEGSIRPDDDEDGVFDDGDDLCLGTPKGTPVDTTGCPLNAFPVNNFSIAIQSETCRQNNDGSITISATDETINYSATLTGNETNENVDFNNEFLFSNLSSGNYQLCITGTDGVISYRETCFDLVIEQPEELSVLANLLADDLVLLQLSGGAFYNIELNGEVEQTTEREFSLPLRPGLNILKVSTGVTCQGVFEKQYFNGGAPVIFPNPASNRITISSQFSDEKVMVTIFTADGRLVQQQAVLLEGGNFKLNVSELANGLYYLILEAKELSQTAKLIKQ